jgi:hypothetical protein
MNFLYWQNILEKTENNFFVCFENGRISHIYAGRKPLYRF